MFPHITSPPAKLLRAFLPCLLLLPLLGGCGFVSAENVSSPPADALAVNFIDVGQGDSVLVQTGGESYLIDAGKPEAGTEVVDFLRSRGVVVLDGVVATHPDADHVGGLPDVLDAFEVRRVYLSGEVKGTLTENAFLQSVEREGAPTEEVRAGDAFEWGRAEVRVLSPPAAELFDDSNENSVALMLEYGEARVLLPGDAEEDAEEYMSGGPYTGPVTVLKVGHHGSDSSTTPLFLGRFPPEIAVISAGEDNAYGHPTPGVLGRLNDAGAEVFRTDEHGDVIVTVQDGQVEVAITEY